MATVRVTPGACGLTTVIRATADEAYLVTLDITSECGRIQCMAEQLPQVSALADMRKPIQETAIYRCAGACRTHAACPVPCALHKAVEVAAGLALPADVHLAISSE